ncbi:hypothetical protein G5B37_08450 [Rasiella rasia]|uniref:Uncharacterized protein n=1 Tax=Rasiella rasia TaxID=2744027 RepID=A0A6G6GPF2_9FLAO|nr:hypothetical protein [Rasiella rasia]QIE59591.1 hypothetical protein G5B37_08450 [Rasiella rasia]
MKILHLTAMAALFAFTSCCTSSKTTKGNDSLNSLAESKKMMEDGFMQGTIVASTAENDCPYVIKSEIDGATVMYDPTNLEQGFMKDGMKVWYKYSPLRMMNRCDKASPVNLTEIKAM